MTAVAVDGALPPGLAASLACGVRRRSQALGATTQGVSVLVAPTALWFGFLLTEIEIQREHLWKISSLSIGLLTRSKLAYKQNV